MSSMQALCLSLARRSRLVSCREWRSVSSRSTSRTEPLLERQGFDLGRVELLGEGLGHPGAA